MRQRKLSFISLIFGILFILMGCTSTPKIPDCRLPTGYTMDYAIVQGSRTISDCPERWEEVIVKLIEIGKYNPKEDNCIKIF